MKYLINKTKNKLDIIYMEYDIDGYIFKPKNQYKNNLISVESVNIVYKDFISNLISLKFQSKFKKLSNLILNLIYDNDEDCDEGDLMILLDEIKRLQSIMEIKYKKHIKIEEYKEYLSKLMFLDQQIREQLAIKNYRARMENTKGRSR